MPDTPPAAGYVLAVDLGGTQIRTALFDRRGSLLRHVRRPTEGSRGLAQVVDNVVSAIAEASQDCAPGTIVGLGFGAPGPINPKTGVVFTVASLPDWKDVPLRDMLVQRLNLPVFMDNDANLAALGEYTFGAAKGYRHLAYLTVSTGIGAGIISDGCILEGALGLAGEVGHATIDLNGPRCPCGNVGCFAMLASGGAIRAHAIEVLQAPEGRSSLLWELSGGNVEAVSSMLVADAAFQGDALALEVLRKTGKYLGVGITNLLHTYNPDVVVIGGGVALIGPLVLDPAREWVEQTAIPIFRENVPIVPAQLGDDAGLYGAYALAASRLASRQTSA